MAKFIVTNGPCRILFFCPKNYSYTFVWNRVQSWNLKNANLTGIGLKNGQVYLEVEFPNVKTAANMQKSVRDYFENISKQPNTQSLYSYSLVQPTVKSVQPITQSVTV